MRVSKELLNMSEAVYFTDAVSIDLANFPHIYFHLVFKTRNANASQSKSVIYQLHHFAITASSAAFQCVLAIGADVGIG